MREILGALMGAPRGEILERARILQEGLEHLNRLRAIELERQIMLDIGQPVDQATRERWLAVSRAGLAWADEGRARRETEAQAAQDPPPAPA